MRVGVLGGGALGSVLAGHLARAGHAVTVLARGERAGHLRAKGITLAGLSDFTVACPVVTSPRELPPADVFFVTVKTYDTAAALAPLRGLDVGAVLSVQNGILKDEQLATTFTPERVLGAAAFFAGEVLASGVARFTLNGGLCVGELPAGTSPRVTQLVDALAGAGIKASASADIRSVEWSKFAAWVGGMALAVLTRLPTYRMFTDRDIALVGVRLIRETGAVATRQGIALQDVPPFLVRQMTDGTEAQAVETLGAFGRLLQAQAPTHRVSGLHDLERGRHLEVEETLGHLVATAAALGVAVPTVETAYRLIRGIDRTLDSPVPGA
jgi:2-dehydropantoate 2-reductase